MALTERKITTWTKSISSLADRPQMSAAELKAAFDSNTNEIKPKFNGLVDDLTGSGGAGEIGASVEGVTGTTVSAVLAALKALIDLRETTESTDEKLGEKANQTTVDKTFRDISVNENTGVITLTCVDGTTKTVNTSLSKIAVNFGFDSEMQKITLLLNDGTTEYIDVSAFIKPNEIVDSGNIAVSRNADGTVSLSVKSGSISADMLTGTILDELKAYRDAAASSAQNAAASESNAETYKNAAEAAKTGAQTAASQAEAEKTSAAKAAEDALASKKAAAASVTEAGNQASAASGYAVRAEEALSKMGVHIGSGAPANGARLWLCPVNNPLIMNPDRATIDMTQEVGVNDDGKLVTTVQDGSISEAKLAQDVKDKFSSLSEEIANIGGGAGTGAPGKSAYQYAVEGGYTGTEAEFAAKLAEEIPDKLPNPKALTFTGAVTGSYDGSSPLEINIPSGGSSGGSGKAKTQKLIDITFSEPTASLSVTLEHNFHRLLLVWTCGVNGVARTVDADGNAVSGNLCVVLDSASAGYNARKIGMIQGNTSLWQTNSLLVEFSDDLSTFLRAMQMGVATSAEGGVKQVFGGSTAMKGTLGTDALAPEKGRTLNIVPATGLFAETTRMVLVGEYYD